MINQTGQGIKNKELFAFISQYIEDHYEGYSYREAYHFGEAARVPVRRKPDTPKTSLFPSAASSSEENEDDVFGDILKIFTKQDTAGHPNGPRSDRVQQIRGLLEEHEHAETFSEHLLRTISEKHYTESEVYHRVFMDRKLFNKIRNTPNYQPSKRTALLLAIALKLTVPEAQELLGKAGYTLTHCSKTDLIVECCLLQGVYDIFAINEMLEAFGMPPLINCE